MNSKLNCYDFGRLLLKTKDLDPVYCLLYPGLIDTPGRKLETWDPRMKPWLLAYWCYYDVGTASLLAHIYYVHGEARFWDAMMVAAKNEDRSWARGSERRHFRAKNAISSIEFLQRRGMTQLFSDILDCKPEAAVVSKAVQQWNGFGPWIAFKVADMLERLERPITFDIDDVYFFDSPREGARILVHEWEGLSEAVDPERTANRLILERLKDFNAPPRYERRINVQETETILCKWKSYLKGSYSVGEDIEHCKKSLLKYPRHPLTQSLFNNGKSAGLWT